MKLFGYAAAAMIYAIVPTDRGGGRFEYTGAAC